MAMDQEEEAALLLLLPALLLRPTMAPTKVGGERVWQGSVPQGALGCPRAAVGEAKAPVGKGEKAERGRGAALLPPAGTHPDTVRVTPARVPAGVPGASASPALRRAVRLVPGGEFSGRRRALLGRVRSLRR
jgi:hypothetical protein